MKTMIDPLRGWNYGFPKELPAEVKDVRSWLIENGYPESQVDFAMKYLRMWVSEEGIDE